jgi:hypothetical protein
MKNLLTLDCNTFRNPEIVRKYWSKSVETEKRSSDRFRVTLALHINL